VNHRITRNSVAATILIAAFIFFPARAFAKSKSLYCGPEVLRQVYESFDIKYSLARINQKAQARHGLTSFADLLREAARHKLRTLAFKKGSLALLQEAVKHGYVVFNNRGHFSLIEKIDDRSVHIFDPGFGVERYSLSFPIFEHHWDGYGVVLSRKSIKLSPQEFSFTRIPSGELSHVLGANSCSNVSGGGGTYGGGANRFAFGNGPPGNAARSANNRGSPSTQDPVHIQNGNLHLDVDDLYIPARGLPLTLTRYYNAQVVSEVPGWLPDPGAGSWTVENGEYSGEGDRSTSDEAWGNFTLELDMKTLTTNGAFPWEVGWINFRYADADNRYYLVLRTDGLMELAKRQNHTSGQPPFVLAQAPSGVSPFNTNHFKIEVLNNNIKIYVNSQLKINITDSNPLMVRGRIGLEAHYSHAHFDNVTVTGESNNRSYHFDADDNDFIFGYGWSHSYSMRIREYPSHLTLIRENNSREIYEPQSGGTYRSVGSDTYSDLSKDASGFTLRSKYGIVYRFDLGGKLLYVEDRNGNRTTLSYTLIGGKDRLTTVASPGTRKIVFQYGANNMVQSVQDSAGYLISYYYDSANHLIRVTDRENQNVNYAYDLVTHNLTQIRDKENNTYAYSYAYNDRVLAQTDPMNRVTKFDYNWDTVHVINHKNEQFKYNFDSKAFLQSMEDPLTNNSRTQNDANGNIVDYWDKNGRNTHYVYDAKGNVTSIRDARNQQEAYTYDLTYNLPLTYTNKRNFTWNYQYDGRGNLTRLRDPLNNDTVYAYDQYGQLASVKDARGNTSSYAYNSDGDMISASEPDRRVTLYEYDKLGRVTKVTNVYGLVTEMTYDRNGRLLSVKDPLNRVSTNKYSANGHLTSVVDAMNRTTSFTYDPFGNELTGTDANRGVVTQTHDTDNELHLAVSNLTSLQDPRLNPATNFVYDPLNRLLRQTDAQSRQINFTYDRQGNLTRKVDSTNRRTDYVYDEVNRLIFVDHDAGADITYQLDAVGNITQYVDIEGTTTQTFDALNRLSTVNYLGRYALRYEYDAVGNRTKIVYPSGLIVEYAYNPNNEMIGVKRNGTALASYGYDALGRRCWKQIYGQTPIFTVYMYDAADQLTYLVNYTVSDPSSNTEAFIFLSGYMYTYDQAGNRTGELSLQGMKNFRYDSIDQLLAVSGAQNFSYSYDAAGNRLQAGTVNYTTNNLNQYTQVGANSYSYDANGNLISDGLRTYNYDHENHLVRTQAGTTFYAYNYDGLGRRCVRNMNSTSYTIYVNDGHRVIEEFDINRQLLATYIYGPGLDEIITMERGGAPYFYLYDGLGSARELTDRSVKILERYSYDPFGMPLNFSSYGNVYLFAGQRYDPETGLYYMRARHYHPGIGRFLQRDPIGFADDVNLYRYVGNNPVNFVDPFGLCGEWGPTNLGWQFLHESNPFNPNSTMRQQMRSWGAFYTGDWGTAAALSGQSIVEKTNKKGDISGWQKWYWGTQIAAATAVTTAIGAGTGAIPNWSIGWKGGEITLTRPGAPTPDWRFNPIKGHYHRRPGIGQHRPWEGGW